MQTLTLFPYRVPSQTFSCSLLLCRHAGVTHRKAYLLSTLHCPASPCSNLNIALGAFGALLRVRA